jgi:hypothetical protein
MARIKQANPKRMPTVTKVVVSKRKHKNTGSGSSSSNKRKIKDLSLNPTLKEQFEADQAKRRKQLASAKNVDVSQIEKDDKVKQYNKRRARHAFREENTPELANDTRKWPSFMRMQYDQYQTFMQNQPPVGNGHGFALAQQTPPRRRERARLVIRRPMNDGRRAPPNSP